MGGIDEGQGESGRRVGGHERAVEARARAEGLEKWQRQISRVRFGRRKERVMKRRRLQISLRFLGLGEEEER